MLCVAVAPGTPLCHRARSPHKLDVRSPYLEMAQALVQPIAEDQDDFPPRFFSVTNPFPENQHVPQEAPLTLAALSSQSMYDLVVLTSASSLPVQVLPGIAALSIQAKLVQIGGHPPVPGELPSLLMMPYYSWSNLCDTCCIIPTAKQMEKTILCSFPGFEYFCSNQTP